MVHEWMFLGSGNSQSPDLGNAAAVWLMDGKPRLLVDCGWSVPQLWQREFAGLPPAVFLTHVHMDHCAGLENWYYQLAVAAATGAPQPLLKLYCPAELVPLLQQRLGAYPEALAEGGSNFWDVFQLIPVGRQFWLDDVRCEVFPTRHHRPNSAFGLAVPGLFFYSGDTRPIPEWVTALAASGETVFHDAGVEANPAHAGLDDLAREYSANQRERMVLYHLEDEAAVQQAEAAGYRVARPGDVFDLGRNTQVTGAETLRPTAQGPRSKDSGSA